MKSRCENKNREKYEDYGMRGISVCQEWKSFEAFCKWAHGNGYSPELQIDRINNDAGYAPDNCRFVTPKLNSRNRRNTKMITLNGETKCVSEWCEKLNVSAFTIYWWIKTKGCEYAESRLKAIA
jgi:hypothetical protein